jgi:hypothetical protein
MIKAIRQGEADLVKIFIEKGSTNMDDGLYHATFTGHRELGEAGRGQKKC